MSILFGVPYAGVPTELRHDSEDDETPDSCTLPLGLGLIS